MRKLTNFLGFCGYLLLTVTGLTWIGNKFLDLSEKNKEPIYPKEPKTSKTVYPEHPCKSENEWYQYIDKQLN